MSGSGLVSVTFSQFAIKIRVPPFRSKRTAREQTVCSCADEVHKGKQNEHYPKGTGYAKQR